MTVAFHCTTQRQVLEPFGATRACELGGRDACHHLHINEANGQVTWDNFDLWLIIIIIIIMAVVMMITGAAFFVLQCEIDAA